MSQTDQNTSDLLEEDKTSLKRSEEFLGPDLAFSLYGAGYTRAGELRDKENTFSTYSHSLDAYDNLSEDNVLVEESSSARVFENYFGQYSFGNESLETYLEEEREFTEGFMEDVRALDGSLVMDINLFEYDGQQHVRYTEGQVSTDLVQHVIEEAPEDLVIMDISPEERISRLFIRSNP